MLIMIRILSAKYVFTKLTDLCVPLCAAECLVYMRDTISTFPNSNLD